jgi:hypothetical protein
VQSIADLARLGDRVHEYGQFLLWGPVRHGVGNNIAAYFADPCGVVVEYYTDMQKIYNDSDYEPIVWGDEWRSLWMQTTATEFRRPHKFRAWPRRDDARSRRRGATRRPVGQVPANDLRTGVPDLRTVRGLYGPHRAVADRERVDDARCAAEHHRRRLRGHASLAACA